jgi:hypothetical protein
VSIHQYIGCRLILLHVSLYYVTDATEWLPEACFNFRDWSWYLRCFQLPICCLQLYFVFNAVGIRQERIYRTHSKTYPIASFKRQSGKFYSCQNLILHIMPIIFRQVDDHVKFMLLFLKSVFHIFICYCLFMIPSWTYSSVPVIDTKMGQSLTYRGTGMPLAVTE